MENILNLSSTGFDYFVLFCIEFAIGGNETFYWEFERNFVSYFPFDICKKKILFTSYLSTLLVLIYFY